MFDRVLLLSKGCVAYEGTVSEVRSHFESCGIPIPLYMNPAEFLIDTVNTDFATGNEKKSEQLAVLHAAWRASRLTGRKEDQHLVEMPSMSEVSSITHVRASVQHASSINVVLALIHRSFIKSYRDILAYGIRIAMYMGLAIMMGTVWLRLGTNQSDIQPFTNAIFFGGAFMSASNSL